MEETPGPLNDIQREFVSTIAQNSNLVIDMAADLLAEARLEAELFQIHLERVDVRHLVRECVADLRRVHQAPIHLDSHGAPLYMSVDPRLMRQAISNVITNAARHAGPDVRIHVSVVDGEDAVTVSVSDNGEGMSSEERAMLFVPFATGGSQRPGTGLGLMITQRIVELHGGRVLVDTITRRGTTVFLSLPLKWTPSPQIKADEDQDHKRWWRPNICLISTKVGVLREELEGIPVMNLENSAFWVKCKRVDPPADVP